MPMVAVVSGTGLFRKGWLRWTGGLPPRRSTLMHAPASQLNCFIVCNHVHKVAECRAWTGRNFSATITARISWS